MEPAKQWKEAIVLEDPYQYFDDLFTPLNRRDRSTLAIKLLRIARARTDEYYQDIEQECLTQEILMAYVVQREIIQSEHQAEFEDLRRDEKQALENVQQQKRWREQNPWRRLRNAGGRWETFPDALPREMKYMKNGKDTFGQTILNSLARVAESISLDDAIHFFRIRMEETDGQLRRISNADVRALITHVSRQPALSPLPSSLQPSERFHTPSTGAETTLQHHNPQYSKQREGTSHANPSLPSTPYRSRSQPPASTLLPGPDRSSARHASEDYFHPVRGPTPNTGKPSRYETVFPPTPVSGEHPQASFQVTRNDTIPLNWNESNFSSARSQENPSPLLFESIQSSTGKPDVTSTLLDSDRPNAENERSGYEEDGGRIDYTEDSERTASQGPGGSSRGTTSGPLISQDGSQGDGDSVGGETASHGGATEKRGRGDNSSSHESDGEIESEEHSAEEEDDDDGFVPGRANGKRARKRRRTGTDGNPADERQDSLDDDQSIGSYENHTEAHSHEQDSSDVPQIHNDEQPNSTLFDDIATHTTTFGLDESVQQTHDQDQADSTVVDDVSTHTSIINLDPDEDLQQTHGHEQAEFTGHEQADSTGHEQANSSVINDIATHAMAIDPPQLTSQDPALAQAHSTAIDDVATTMAVDPPRPTSQVSPIVLVVIDFDQNRSDIFLTQRNNSSEPVMNYDDAIVLLQEQFALSPNTADGSTALPAAVLDVLRGHVNLVFHA